MFNGKCLMTDFMLTLSNEDIPTVSTRLVLSQTSVNIFNNSMEINFKRKHRKLC